MITSIDMLLLTKAKCCEEFLTKKLLATQKTATKSISGSKPHSRCS